MTLVSEYSRYYRFLRFIITFLRFDFLPINCFLLRHIRMSFYPALAAFHFVATSHMLYYVMLEGDMVTFSFGTIWFSGSLQAFIKTITAIYYKEQFLIFFAGIEEIVKTHFDTVVDVIVKKILKETLTLTKICHFSITVIFNSTVFLLVMNGMNSPKGQPLGYYLPVFSWWGNFSFQLYGAWLILYTVLAGDFIFIALALFFRGELLIIAEIILCFDDSQFVKDNIHLLRMIYKMHLRILKKLGTFQNVYYFLTFLQIVSSFFLICLTTFMIRFHDLQAWAYAVLLCGLMQTFFLCLIGDILFEKASLISTALYLTKWYEMELEDQGRLLIMIAMAQKPYGIKAAGLVDVSFFTFIEIIKLSVSYCAILFTVA
ncbi:odorant receptor 85b-like [Lutzomyia longipalpis]|uniref:odorant receptor 85b-like n=1 Tax=Lutzomyia longipalpis TaxID=7200 RepID=UPI002483BE09|nr:odorant receptor 85b-like [Lutzomyia longipalpis]